MTVAPITLTTGYVTAALTLPPDISATPAANAVYRLLPGGWSLHTPAPQGARARLLIDVSDGPPGAETIGDGTIRLRLTRTGAASARLCYASYIALERARQQQRMATVHASAACTPQGQAVLLLGNKGPSETSTTLALAARGFAHLGDGLVVLGERDNGVTVFPGKQAAAIHPAHPLLANAPKPVVELQPFRQAPAPLGRIIRVTIHPGVAETCVTPATPLSSYEYLRLHENLARYISGIPTPLDGITDALFGRVWPLDTPACARWRTRLVSLLEGRYRFDYLYAPDAEQAADLIAETTKSGAP